MKSTRVSRRDFMVLGAAGTLAGCTLPSGKGVGRAADVCVYGGTASGVTTAVAASREGCRVILVEPSRWLGGITGGGLSHIDWGRAEAVGGATRKLLSDGINDLEYRQLFERLVKEHGITVIYERRAYTAPVRKELKGKANVHRAPVTCGPTAKFLQSGEGWLKQNGSERWGIIIVNFGIHDGKNPSGDEGRLRKVIARLKQTGAKEIFWVRTTPWGKDASVFYADAGDASKITNPVSDRVAKEEGLEVMDAHAVMAPRIETDLSRKDFTHWTPEAYDRLGAFVAAAIEPCLE